MTMTNHVPAQPTMVSTPGQKLHTRPHSTRLPLSLSNNNPGVWTEFYLPYHDRECNFIRIIRLIFTIISEFS